MFALVRILLFLLFMCPSVVMAQNVVAASDTVDSHLMDESAKTLRTVTVLGKSKAQQLKEGAYSVNAIDVKQLAGMSVTLDDVVGRTAGVKVRTEGGAGSDFDLSINGMSGNSVRFFIDGVPADIKGSSVNLANMPLSIVDRVEVYKGVVPAFLGTDALGGAVNIITKKRRVNYLDASYTVGSFGTHKADVSGQYVEPSTGLIIKPSFGVEYSKNNYMMRDVEVPNEDRSDFVTADRRRFHDDYFSLQGSLEVGVAGRQWADELFVGAMSSKVDKELQTGSVQTKVYGMAERTARSLGLSARYLKEDFIAEGLSVSMYASHTWDHSQTVDTTFRKYYWDGSYIEGSRSEITGRGKTWRHYRRPLTVGRVNFDYVINDSHSLNLNYMLNRTGNEQTDDVDAGFEPSDDALFKHVSGLSYNQLLLGERMANTFFVKNYVNHLSVEQKDLSFITGSDKVTPSSTKSYWGYGAGSRLRLSDFFSIKASYEHSVRLPLSRELLGNGTTIYANVALRPENSDNVNLGFFGNVRLGEKHVVQYEANGFVRLVDDYIQATVSEKEGMMQYKNVPAVHIKGVEGEVRYIWNSRLHVSANASYQDSRDRRKYKDDGKLSATYNNRTPNKPWMFCNAEVAYMFHNVGMEDSRLRLSADYQWVHWFYLTWEAYGADASKARIPTQNVTNLAALYSWRGNRYSLSLECANLFDTKAYDNFKLQKPGRAFYAKFRLLIE